MKQLVTEELTLQQDYLWFLAAVVLIGACVASRQLAQEGGRTAWIGRFFAGSLLMTLAELARLAQTVRAPEYGEPNLVLDLLHGAVLAGQVAVLWWSGARPIRMILLVAGLAVATVLRYPYPWSTTLVLAALATLGVWHRTGRGAEESHAGLRWILIPALWFSPIGPGTGVLNNWLTGLWAEGIVAGTMPGEGPTAWTVGLRRWSMTGPWGLWSAAVLLVTGWLALRRLIRWQWPEAERRELRRFLPWIAVWLAGGMLLAAGLGWNSRREFEDSQKLRANLAAKLLARETLADAFGAKFDPRPWTGAKNTLFAEVGREFREAVGPVRRQLDLIQEELPDDAFAFILVERNGLRAVAAVAARFPSLTDRVMVLEPEPGFARDPAPRFLPPYHEVYGLVTQARTPLFFPDGKFLGWLVLEFGAGEWLGGQTRTRLQGLAIVGLGFGIALISLRSRLKNLARDEALRAAEAARQADRTKTEFLARVSHELRTPIQSVLGYGELLQSAVQDETARSRLGALRQHGLLMLRLVNDLLDLGALQSGRFHLSPRPTRVSELVQQSVESLRPRAESKGLTFSTVVAGNPGEWRMADGERLRQIVLNLVANAIKFTDTGAVQVVFAAHGEDEMVLKVSDTGPGISPAAEKKIFQPFARLENTASKEGTGLGLVLAKALCESMGGGIALEPQARGACFVARFRLPVVAAPEHQDASPVRSLRGRQLLVVDDNTLIRELFSSYLQELGARCEVAPDGPVALQLAAMRAYDAIILDLALPGMNGTEVACLLRARAGNRVRIIGVSAHASADDRAQALAAGMDSFLTKPVDLRTLVDEIEHPGVREDGVSPRLTGLSERLRAQFRAEAPVLEAALVAALADADWSAMFAKAHYLRNSAHVLGLAELASACGRLEEAAADHQLEAAELATQACRHQLQAWR